MSSDSPASLAGIDPMRVRRALVRSAGNVVAAARSLGVKPHELRLLVRVEPELLAAAFEREERRLDEAEAEVRAGLRSPNLRTRLAAAGYILRFTEAGRRRMGG